jgi:predicted Co/Zn/Cd cation transporter (cation efflux family)
MRPEQVLTWGGVIVALAFFALIAYVVTVLRASQKLALIVAAVATLAGVLPAILYALTAVR